MKRLVRRAGLTHLASHRSALLAVVPRGLVATLAAALLVVTVVPSAAGRSIYTSMEGVHLKTDQLSIGDAHRVAQWVAHRDSRSGRSSWRDQRRPRHPSGRDRRSGTLSWHISPRVRAIRTILHGHVSAAATLRGHLAGRPKPRGLPRRITGVVKVRHASSPSTWQVRRCGAAKYNAKR